MHAHKKKMLVVFSSRLIVKPMICTDVCTVIAAVANVVYVYFLVLDSCHSTD